MSVYETQALKIIRENPLSEALCEQLSLENHSYATNFNENTKDQLPDQFLLLFSKKLSDHKSPNGSVTISYGEAYQNVEQGVAHQGAIRIQLKVTK